MCKKSIYSTESTWYDQGVYNAIMALDNKHDNAIPVFGAALGAYENIHCESPDYTAFVSGMLTAAGNAKFYNWHGGVINAMRTFCHICLVDPMLIELYMDATFEEVAAHMLED